MVIFEKKYSDILTIKVFRKNLIRLGKLILVLIGINISKCSYCNFLRDGNKMKAEE